MDEERRVVDVPQVFWWTGFPLMDEVNRIVESASEDAA